MIRTIVAAFAAVILVSISVAPAQAGLTKGRTVETGQTTSYGSGSDGDLERGLSRSFLDLGNGVVKDQRTGLFWEKKSDDGSIHDKDDTYTWSPGSPWLASGTAFGQFLATLNTPPCFGNF